MRGNAYMRLKRMPCSKVRSPVTDIALTANMLRVAESLKSGQMRLSPL